MSNKIIFSIDVEPDLHTGKFDGITIGLSIFEGLCDKHNIKPTLFVTGTCIQEHPDIFTKLKKKGWDISSHGFSHKRFDEMSFSEKEDELKSVLKLFKNKLKMVPKGFRAPQHSIDSDTLDLLEKYGFEYDSSYTPLNLLQLFFFPSRFKKWLGNFISPLNPYKIRKNLIEIPTSSLIIPFVSLTVRIFPKSLIRIYLYKLRWFYKEPVFYAHSWDFIKLNESKVDSAFSHKRFIKNLDYLMSLQK
ncbi:hypothetical protein COU60_00875 [Candidatus Pacearchaeota archaeon CG10_big_fil_rev_8_21_14_0_10_34_76]|nr:MAG: hypothetical protein COU60_00875 [Candidatus Pacearchaeota archaeon CG10_big_fil_rev_8_21_14_0_10_34_76]